MKVFIDFDSTLCDSTDRWHDWVRKSYHSPFLLEDVTHYSYIQDMFGINTMEWWKDKSNYTTDVMKPFVGAFDFISDVTYMFGTDDVYIATYSFDEILDVKTKLISEMFCIAPHKIIHSRNKWRYTRDGILIDDNISNCLVHQEVNNAPAILFNLDNRHPWSDIEVIMKLNQNIGYNTSYDGVLEGLRKIDGRK